MNSDFLAYVQKLELMAFFFGISDNLYSYSVFFGWKKTYQQDILALAIVLCVNGYVIPGFSIEKAVPVLFCWTYQTHNSATLFCNMGASFYLFLDPGYCKKSSFKFNS